MSEKAAAVTDMNTSDRLKFHVAVRCREHVHRTVVEAMMKFVATTTLAKSSVKLPRRKGGLRAGRTH